VSVITLTTDFGSEDEYVGVMKGVILSICPQAVVVDITHSVAPQHILSAAYLLSSAYPFFPTGTVHVVVVDPGVGTDRRVLAARVNGHFFLAPDNGVLTPLVQKGAVEEIRTVTASQYFLKPVSNTFHGRDIFCPVAAHLAGGVDFDRLGATLPIEEMVLLKQPIPRVSKNGEIKGVVIAIDHFGNLLTNIEAELIAELEMRENRNEMAFHLNGVCVTGLSVNYDSVQPGLPLAVIGSRGRLEIAVNHGNAADHFNAQTGDEIKVTKLQGDKVRE